MNHFDRLFFLRIIFDDNNTININIPIKLIKDYETDAIHHLIKFSDESYQQSIFTKISTRITILST